MKKRHVKVICSSLLILLLVFNTFQLSAGAKTVEEDELVAKLNNRGFKEEENLGMPATGAVLTSAIFGVENGREVGYTTANGGIFSAVDVVNNELLFTGQLEGISIVWTHSIASDGTVYIAGLSEGNAGTLWSYSPETKSLKKHGVADSSHQFWSSATDDEGNVYIGTYKEGEGKVFKYDKTLDKFIDFGKVDEEGDSSYVRSLAYYDGYIYAGLGVTGNVYKINVDDPSDKENITKNVPEILDIPHKDISFAYDMAVAGDYLVVRFDGVSAILFYDLIEGKWVDDVVIGKKDDGSEEDFGSFGFHQLPVHNNKTYVINDRKVLEIDIETLETRETGIDYPAGWRGLTFADFGEDGSEDIRLVNFQRDGALLKFNIADKTRESLPLAISGDQPFQLHNLGLGPDGNLYMTTYPGGPRGAQYNTKTGAFQSYAQGQAEGMIAGNGTDMFFGIYTGAVIQKMNTETLEISNLFNLKDEYEQDRPYIMKFEDDKLLIGTIPDYQKLGGTFTIFDPETEERETYRNVIQDHSIVGLAMKGGKIYGSTTIRGGLDTVPTADNAKMFVWDIEGKKKITDFEIELPGLGKSPMISGLTFDDDGLLWGAVDGFLFAMDPDTYEIVKHKNIYPDIVNRGMWRPVHIHFGDDGLLYTDIGGKLAVVDPKSTDLNHVSLIESGPELSFMELAYDAEGNQNIYYINEPNYLKMISVIDNDNSSEEPVYETVNVLLNNPGFEGDLGEDGSIPGWSSLFTEVTENVSFEVTDEKSKSGNYSLKITDRSQTETVFVQSDFIPIDAGTEYTGSVDMYLEDGSASFFMRYFDDEGKQVGGDEDGVNIIHVRSEHGSWQTVTATVIAPEGAKYARLFAGSSKFFTTSGAYYDDFQLTFEEEVSPEEHEELKVVKVKQMEKLEVEVGTSWGDLELPKTVGITLNDDTTVDVPVIWNANDSDYDGNVSGTYKLTGQLDLSSLTDIINPSNLQVLLNVIVQKGEEVPVDPDDLSITKVDKLDDLQVNFGTKKETLDLPTTVKVSLSDGTTETVNVLWDNGTPEYDRNKHGTYKFTGTLDLSSNLLNPNSLTATISIFVKDKIIVDPDDPKDSKSDNNKEDLTPPKIDKDEKGNDEVSVSTDKKDEFGEPLPNTATTIYNFLAFGMLFLFAGAGLLIWRRKRTA